jgi:hypothetical protein
VLCLPHRHVFKIDVVEAADCVTYGPVSHDCRALSKALR